MAQRIAPVSLAMVLVLTASIGLVSTGGAPDHARFALTLAAMLCVQLAIGWSNDYLDREADAVHQPSKPVASGAVEAGRMPVAIAGALVGALVAGALLGPAPLGFLAIGAASGLAYNLGLKATPVSALPFVVAFTVLPLYVWTALDVFSRDLVALYGIGAPLPLAVHLANVLPDRETDAAQGRRTVAVRLGRSTAVRLIATCLAAPVALTALSLPWLAYDAPVLAVTVAGFAVLSLAVLGLYRASARRAFDVWAFRLAVVASILFATGWLAAVQG